MSRCLSCSGVVHLLSRSVRLRTADRPRPYLFKAIPGCVCVPVFTFVFVCMHRGRYGDRILMSSRAVIIIVRSRYREFPYNCFGFVR